MNCRCLRNLAVPGTGMQDNLSEHPERFFVGEIIREKIFMLYHEEIPYATMVRGPEQPHLLCTSCLYTCVHMAACTNQLFRAAGVWISSCS